MAPIRKLLDILGIAPPSRQPATHDRHWHETLHLEDGRQVDYAIRLSSTRRTPRLKFDTRQGLVLVAPPHFKRPQLIALVEHHRDWVARRLPDFQRIQQEVAILPEVILLKACAESWLVEYRSTQHPTLRTHSNEPQRRLRLSGPVEDHEACRRALRRWLMRQAQRILPPWLDRLAEETALHPSRIAIRHQRKRWGSCSTTGGINLNGNLLFLEPDLVRYVMLHELCHLNHPNHSPHFWAALHRLDPRTEDWHRQLRAATMPVPLWAQY